MKIVLLGGGGMLGSALLREFSSRGILPEISRASNEISYEVVPLDRDELDITNRDEVFRVLSGFSPKIVINAAGYTAVDDAEKNRETVFSVNGEAVSYLAEFCRENGVLLIHFSTDYVFDGEKNGGYDETDRPHPLNVYGESKAKGEEYIFESGIPFDGSFGSSGCYLIRTSWLFGDGGDGGDGGKNFVDTMLRLGREKKEIRVVNDQIGKPTFTLDLARATRKLLETKMPFGIYHLVNEDAVSWYDFSREIFEIAGFEMADFDFSHLKISPVSSDEFRRPARRPRNSVLLNTKFPLLRSHREALREYLKNGWGTSEKLCLIVKNANLERKL